MAAEDLDKVEVEVTGNALNNENKKVKSSKCQYVAVRSM